MFFCFSPTGHPIEPVNASTRLFFLFVVFIFIVASRGGHGVRGVRGGLLFGWFVL